MKWILILAGLLLAPAVAHADPCEGRLPSRSGETFSGLVRYIGDGDSLCLGPSTNSATWIEVRLSDFDAPELNSPTGRANRERLSRLVNGRVLDCVAVRGSMAAPSATSCDRRAVEKAADSRAHTRTF